MLRDGLAFLILTAATAVLFAITLFLFRSFSAHRAALATQAGDRGRLALSQGRPKDAIADLRTALSYAPGERSYELLLAQALGDDGDLEGATNYFLNLWDSQPGDGFINLQLARLSRRRNERQAAIDYYRASIFGSWDGDGVIHRRDVRLELANYLIDQRQFALAQAELLIAASNAPNIPDLSIGLGDSLLRAGDQADALKEFQKAIVQSPRDAVAYERAGRLAYQMGDYVHAREWLEKALRESAGTPGSAADPQGDAATLLKNTERLLALQPELATTRSERINRVFKNGATAKKRFDACLRQATSAGSLPSSMQALTSMWAAAANTTTKAALMRDPANEDTLRDLINDSELLTAQVCGAPQGDDALLLLLAPHRKTRKDLQESGTKIQ